MKLTTIGQTIYPGREVNLFCLLNTVCLCTEAYGTRYQIVHVKDGLGVLNNGGKSQLITAPCILFFNEKEKPELTETNHLLMDILFFEPSIYNEKFHFDYPYVVEGKYSYDTWLFRPYLLRDENYIGACKINWLLSKRVTQLMAQVNEELQIQRDYYWPCRSRSYFAELVILTSSIFEDYKTCIKMSIGTLREETQRIVSYLHTHYSARIMLTDLVNRFHINKTTLNDRFKEDTGSSVMDYLNHLRIEIACSLLRNTELTVSEIMTRVGFKDHAHFGRIFKKYAHTSPSEFRYQNF